jgi:multisubunit Na+/H+ antiporter MnhC subunit
MNADAQLLVLCGGAVALLFLVGLYCLIASRNLVRAVIGMVLMTKACTMLLVVAGNLTGRIALAQALVITAIIVEVVVVAVAVAIVLHIYQHNKSLDTTLLRNLKG